MNIVYLDGVTPPTSRVMSSHNNDSDIVTTQNNVNNDDVTQRLTTGINNHGKVTSALHQRLLQTIREDDSESRLVSFHRSIHIKVHQF